GAPPAPLYLRRAGEAYWFEALSEPKTLYAQFNQVADAPGETLAAFALRLRRAVDEQGTHNLIVDVRHNTGGNAALLTPLLRPNFIGEDTIFVLPSSGLVGSISSRYHQSDPTDFRYWIAPDVPVPLCADAYFSNRDPALETLREILRKRVGGETQVVSPGPSTGFPTGRSRACARSAPGWGCCASSRRRAASCIPSGKSRRDRQGRRRRSAGRL